MMSRSVKTILLLLIGALAVYLAWSPWKTPGGNDVLAISGQQDAGSNVHSRFDGLGLRYNGHYHAQRGNVHYLIRFYPEGRAVLINGTDDVASTLPAFLTRDTQGNPDMGLYNEMVDVRNDSLFFTTHPVKGEIDYRGKVMSTSVVRFNRHSHINGAQYDMEYLFMPDSTASGQ